MVLKTMEETCGEEVIEFSWSGGNTREARKEAALKLLKEEIQDKPLKEGEPLNFVEHSHGGNVLKEFTQLYQGEKKIDTTVSLGTPQREDYQLDWKDTKADSQVINVYDKRDVIQVLGGGITGLAGREMRGATNIPIYQTKKVKIAIGGVEPDDVFPPCLLYTSPSPRD